MADVSTTVSKERRNRWLGALLLLVAPQLSWAGQIVLVGTPDISANPYETSYDGTLFTATGSPDNLKTSAGDTLITNSRLDVSFGIDNAGVVDSSLGGIDVGGTFYDIVIRGAVGGGFPPPAAQDLLLADVLAFDRIAGNGNTIVFSVIVRDGAFVADGTYTAGQQIGMIANIPYGSDTWTGAAFTALSGTADFAPYEFRQAVSAPGSALLMLLAGVAMLRRRRGQPA